jgi:hypothetical protein
MRPLRLITFLLLFLTCHHLHAQTAIPKELQRNWFSTDGNNVFTLGLTQQVACYRKLLWNVISVEKTSDAVKIQIQKKNLRRQLVIRSDGEKAIVLQDGNEKINLRSIRTFHAKHKVIPLVPGDVKFTYGTIKLSGVVTRNQKVDREDQNYVELRLRDEATDETAYLFADLDSNSCFSIEVPAWKFQQIKLHLRSEEIANFFAMPGDSLVIAYNQNMVVDQENPDFDLLLQRTAFMGQYGNFNNLYQHFSWHSKSVGFPNFEYPFKKVKGKSIVEKKQRLFEYYDSVYTSLERRLDIIYPSRGYDKFSVGFLKDDLRFSIARAALTNLKDEYNEKTYYDFKIDSTDIKRIYKRFIASSSTPVWIHPVYYDLAEEYGEKLRFSIFGNSMRYTISQSKVEKRIREEYAPLLSADFTKAYERVKSAGREVERMSMDEVVQKYFDGNKEKAYSFRYLMNQISDQFFKEAEDSLMYEIFKKAIPDPQLRFTTNLSELLDTERSNSRFSGPSVFQLDLFKTYSRIPNTPLQLVDSVNRGQAVQLALASFAVKINPDLITQLDTEEAWQNVLEKYRGKIVVVSVFSHYFDKQHAMRSLHELKKIEEKYKGSNIVFLKCIQQRERNDKMEMLLSYLRLFFEQGVLNNTYYVDKSVSFHALLDGSINGFSVLYNEKGQGHHSYYSELMWEQRDKARHPTLASEIDSLQKGKGRFYEPFADRFFSKSFSSPRYTMLTSSGKYITYQVKEPERPRYDTGDSIFYQISFDRDSVFTENQILLHRQKPSRNKNDMLFTSYTYEKRLVPGSTKLNRYVFNRPDQMLTILDDKKKVVEKFKVVLISDRMLVLERQE